MSNRKKVLVIEDEPMLREVIVYALNDNFDFEISEASSGNEAITLIKNSEPFDLVFSDYKMKDGTGGDVFKHLCTTNYTGGFYLISAYALETMVEFKDQDLFKGEFNYFSKPWKDEDLVYTIEKYLTSL